MVEWNGIAIKKSFNVSDIFGSYLNYCSSMHGVVK